MDVSGWCKSKKTRFEMFGGYRLKFSFGFMKGISCVKQFFSSSYECTKCIFSNYTILNTLFCTYLPKSHHSVNIQDMEDIILFHPQQRHNASLFCALPSKKVFEDAEIKNFQFTHKHCLSTICMIDVTQSYLAMSHF